MGKAKKLKFSKQGSKIALDKQIEEADAIKPKNRNKIRQRKDIDDEVSKYFNFTMYFLNSLLRLFNIFPLL